MPSNGRHPAFAKASAGQDRRLARRSLGEGGLDLDRFVPYRLSVLTNRISNAIARHYSERFGLSIAEWRVMAVLGQSPELSASEVALRTEMDKVQVSRAVASLVRRRRVRKTLDGADGRITRLVLTPRGRAIYDEIVPQALELEERILSGFDSKERAALDRLLSKLSDESRGLDIRSSCEGDRKESDVAAAE